MLALAPCTHSELSLQSVERRRFVFAAFIIPLSHRLYSSEATLQESLVVPVLQQVANFTPHVTKQNQMTQV